VSIKGGMGNTSYFLVLCVSISKTVRDTTKVRLLLMTNKKLHMGFLLASRSMTLDDLKVELDRGRQPFFQILKY